MTINVFDTEPHNRKTSQVKKKQNILTEGLGEERPDVFKRIQSPEIVHKQSYQLAKS